MSRGLVEAGVAMESENAAHELRRPSPCGRRGCRGSPAIGASQHRRAVDREAGIGQAGNYLTQAISG